MAPMSERCILLLLATNSVDTVDPRTAEEISEIDDTIQSAPYRDSFVCVQRSGLRVSDISRLLNRHAPHILHLSGHARETEGFVLDDDYGNVAKIDCIHLGKLVLNSIRDEDPNLCLVFFSFCYSEPCATAISTNVPYAIGVKGEISAEAVLLFSRTFYFALASGRSVQGAFDNACDSLAAQGLDGSDAMVLRVRSGMSAEVPFLSSMGFLKRTFKEALQAHLAEISSHFFEKPVWREPELTLEETYVDLDCGSLTWGDIIESIQKGAEIDPFEESSAERMDLLEATLDWLQKEKRPEFLVIQGTPGSGKSSFTIRLAVKLIEQGYQPIRVRLRDLGMGDDPIAEIAKNVLRVDAANLEQALELDQTKAVLILDGWDELTLVANQNLVDRVGTFLESIRSGVLVRWQGRVPVILTGRPTKAVTCTRNMTAFTRILTIYRFTPIQLRDYLDKLSSVYSKVSDASPDIDIILARYEDDWKLSKGVPSSQLGGSTDVIGWPLLAHVAYRLMMECERPRQTSLLADRTMLLRCLTEHYCIHSRKPSDDPHATEVRSRLEAYELRTLVQETAIAMTVNGTECISHEELEREMELWSNRPKGDRNAKLTAVDPDIFLINYLFKSGVEPLGCEFIHKSLREFAFAQALVDRLKRLAILSDKGLNTIVEVMTATELAILSRRWLSREIWDHVKRQISWEIYRESPENEDPIAFQRGEPPLGIDAWCRIRDRLAEAWTNWAFLNNEMMFSAGEMRPMTFDLETRDRLKGVPIIETAGADARLGAAFFCLCATVHGVLAVRMMETSGLMDHQKNMWEQFQVTEDGGHSQITLSQQPDQRLRFFSPGKGDEELEQSTMKLAMAKINAYYIQINEEFPEKCDLPFLVSIGTALERLCFQYCNLSYSNFSRSNLSGADFQGANLSGAWLYESNLSRANFSMCDLPYVSFRQANLEGASLKSADIESADFREAKGLTLEQVRVTRNWQSAKFDPEFSAKLRELRDSDEQSNAEPHRY